jgi:methylenetetrahydrofolate reductase (NADPH)
VTTAEHPVDTAAESRLTREIAQLAVFASIEINVQDEKFLTQARALLAPSTRIYVSHLPRQKWEDTVATCLSVRRAGFEPVPHIPVRLIDSDQLLAEILNALRRTSTPTEALLISGDYPEAVGPFQAVSQVLETGLLEKYSFRGVSIAGHPEGHPKVAIDLIRDAEREKTRIARQHGLSTRLVTQFLFESAPFAQWVDFHRGQGLDTRYFCGLAGPAKISTLSRYALRCGVGPSIRALGSHGSTLKNLLGEHGPDQMLRQLADANINQLRVTDGVHLFCFGGFLRTAKWLSLVGTRNFSLNDHGGFDA